MTPSSAPQGAGRTVLMIAYHFPPLSGSSGIQRTLRFARHLPELGWRPVVLTAHPAAYPETSDDLLAEVPPGIEVIRAFALDAARHLSILGRYPRALALPDRWMSWRFDAVLRGMQAIRRHRPAIIWSTYPIATAHQIGADLHRRSGLPWIADFRDPMVQSDYPTDPVTKRRFATVEREAFDRAARCIFVTPGAAAIYRDRYPARRDDVLVIENGYDEEAFVGIGPVQPTLRPGGITWLHSGIVYPFERDPTQLFVALGSLRERGLLARTGLRVRFRASVHETMLRDLARDQGLQEVVEILPPLPYRQAIREMVAADALLVLQASDCNQQIPAKLYEYFRAKRPIIGLTDPKGDTAAALRDAGIDAIAPLDDASAIARLIERLLEAGARSSCATTHAIEGASRLGRARQLAACLDAACRA